MCNIKTRLYKNNIVYILYMMLTLLMLSPTHHHWFFCMLSPPGLWRWIFKCSVFIIHMFVCPCICPSICPQPYFGNYCMSVFFLSFLYRHSRQVSILAISHFKICLMYQTYQALSIFQISIYHTYHWGWNAHSSKIWTFLHSARQQM